MLYDPQDFCNSDTPFGRKATSLTAKNAKDGERRGSIDG